jgi:hypothetical protein
MVYLTSRLQSGVISVLTNLEPYHVINAPAAYIKVSCFVMLSISPVFTTGLERVWLGVGAGLVRL